MVADLALLEPALRREPQPGKSLGASRPGMSCAGSKRVRSERGGPDGSVTVRRSEPAGCVLYGPYLHLPQGGTDSPSAAAERPHRSGQPVLGVEILVLSRFQQQWRDFAIAELAGGSATLDFDVPPEHSIEGPNEGRYEFRFFHLGNAALAITAVDLEKLPEDAPDPAEQARAAGGCSGG